VNFAASSAQPSASPWPEQLNGTSVRVNGRSAPLSFVSEGQINAQAPYATEPGDALVEVTTIRGTSLAEPFSVAATAPGIFLHSQSSRAIALNQDNSLNTPEAPEARGRVLTVFLTGIGAVAPPLATGDAAGFGALHRSAANASASIGGVDAPLHFIGLTPGFIGLAQANIEVPAGIAPSAAALLTIRVGDRVANTPSVSVQ
jgi:uncharacterized protein (TIGR03437 family)